jgi:rod shape determining protein RodA
MPSGRTRVVAVGVIRVESARVRSWATRTAGTSWRAFDIQMTIYAALLACVGLAMAYSNTAEAGGTVLSAGATFARGLMWAAIAIVVFVLSAAFDYKWLKTFAWPLYFVNLGLLLSTIAIGVGVGGSARWVSIFGLQFQFSELAKILMIVVLANYLSARWGKLDSLFSILGACLLVGPAWVLVLIQPDLGTSLCFAAILAGMLFMSGASLRWLGALALVVAAAIPVAWTYVLHDYQKQRLISFLDPTADPQGSGYQLLQSQIAVGSGGLTGKGLTNGTQNGLDFLPVQTTDFVFAILAEELGFLGALVVFALFGALLWRVLASAWKARDPFGTLFGAGLASMILFQLLVNVGMVIGIMPITGIPLPFITHGGASLMTLALGLGILQSVNLRQTRAEW